MVFCRFGNRLYISLICRTIGDKMWITGAFLTDSTSKFPNSVYVFLEKEQMTEHTAAFKREETLENKEDTVSQEIIEISETLVLETRNGYITNKKQTN